ncbi:hypothetical protein POTOM_017304 [Populus tomentosa]|uniref:K Homology domain-containing protein n=1 Tax=Populus tomentosa TaxID=118781 RepID=A0A8X7ZXA1_POPTO|nr:hypothetical protein POTOM_017304 [Populus tomentosa]
MTMRNFVTARLLVQNNMVRCVLGKRGDVTQRLRSETGANIRVLAVLRTLMNWSRYVVIVHGLLTRGRLLALTSLCFQLISLLDFLLEFRLVNQHSGMQGLWNPRSQTIEAILQLQNKTSEFSEKGMITRLLVPPSKVGCILGQGGNEVECSTSQSIYFADFNVLIDDALIFFPFSLELGYYLRTLHDENAGAEPECAGPVPGFGLAHNFPGIGPPPSVMMGASNSGGYEPLKANNSPNMNRVLEANNSHNGMNSVIRSGGCDVSSIDEWSWSRPCHWQYSFPEGIYTASTIRCWNKVEAFTSHYGSYEVENHGSSEHLTAAQCIYRSFHVFRWTEQEYSADHLTKRPCLAEHVPGHECSAEPLLKYEGTSKPLLHDCPARCPQILTLHKVPTTTVLSKSLTITALPSTDFDLPILYQDLSFSHRMPAIALAVTLSRGIREWRMRNLLEIRVIPAAVPSLEDMHQNQFRFRWFGDQE